MARRVTTAQRLAARQRREARIASQAGAVRVDHVTLTRATNDLARAVVPALSASVEKHLGGIFERAKKAWPVDTGFSAARLTFEARTIGDTRFIWSITNDASYAYYVKFKRTETEPPAAEKLIFRPALKVVDQIAADAADELVR